MKRLFTWLVVVVGLLIVGYYAFGVLDEAYDLDELDTVAYDSSLTYCTYKITKVTCDKETNYKKDNIICIVCCTTSNKPWPKRVGVNNNCPKKIEFEETANDCEIEATRTGQTCSSCDASKAMAVFECPNQ